MAEIRTPAGDRRTPPRQSRHEGAPAPDEGRRDLRTYFTRRCIGLHLLVLVLVPTFLVAGWWQYNVARSGNDLSWVYTVEWPFFAAYAVYVWWKLIHDKSTPFDRLWAAKQRAAADAAGTPIYQIPGWATDKELSRAVHAASLDARRDPALLRPGSGALESRTESGRAREATARADELPAATAGGDDAGRLDAVAALEGDDARVEDETVVDARVVDVKVVVDEELAAHDAYNRFLFELSRKDPPKRWTTSRRRARGASREPGSAAQPPGAPRRPSLPSGGASGDPGRAKGRD